MKGEEFLVELSEYQLLKKDPAPQSKLLITSTTDSQFNSLYGGQDAESYDQCRERHGVPYLGDGLQGWEVPLKHNIRVFCRYI
jgi:hypothetical protein